MSSTDTQTVALEFRPGINRQSTTYAEEGTWYDCDRVRFRDGRPEVMRGRQRFSTSSFTGNARDLLAWSDNEGERYVGFGTECFLYVNYGGTNSDITPIRASVVRVGALSTQSGSATIIVSSNNHGLITGDHVLVEDQDATVGGNVLLDGVYGVEVVNSNSFTVEFASAADGTSFSNGTLTLNFYIACGLSSDVAGTGWGVGTYGTSTWGTPRAAGSFFLKARQWSLDNWGEDLVANPRGFGIYVWEENGGVGMHAQLISAAPSVVDFMFVTDERHMVALGCIDPITSSYDPLLVRWSDKENYNQWVAAVTNAAGSWRLTGGNRIVGGLVTKGQNLIWTDTNLYSMKYRTDGFVYGFTKIGENCGLAGPHAAVDKNGTVYWMSHDNFYVYDGRVRPLPSTLHKDVFERLTQTQGDKIWAGTNTEFSEVIWQCPSSTEDVDFYVAHETAQDLWYWGTHQYSTWVDNRIFGAIVGSRTSVGQGDLFFIEPKDIYTDDGVPYYSFIESADKDIGDGNEVMFGDRVIPDFELAGAELRLTFSMKNEPNQSYRTKGPYTVSSGTRRIPVRIRGRQVKQLIESNMGGYWQYGKPRLDVKPDGQR